MAHIKFVVNEEKYIIDLHYIKEIVPFLKVLKGDHSNIEKSEGYINLRGSLIPVIDLSNIFFKIPAIRTLNSRILILEDYENKKKHKIGAIVDQIIDINKFAKERFIYDFLSKEWIESVVMDLEEVVKKINPNYLFNLCYSNGIKGTT